MMFGGGKKRRNAAERSRRAVEEYFRGLEASEKNNKRSDENAEGP